MRKLVVVSHAAVVPVNQTVFVELRRRGWCITLVTPRTWTHEYASDSFRAEALPELVDGFVPLPVLLEGRPQRHVYLSRIVRSLRRWRPDVVFAEQEPFSVPAAQWAWATSRVGIPFGVQAAENLDRPLPAPARAIRSFVLPRTSFVAARSPAAGDLVKQWGYRGRMDLVPHAIPEWSRASERVGAGPFTVGFAGRLVPEKGIWDLVEAMRLLPAPVRLLLVGDGALRGELETCALPNGEIEVRTGVRHEEMAASYRDMDVLVLPSRTTDTWAEQFGRVLVEALWCGVPVIGSSSGEIPWVIRSTGGGLVFSEGDVAELATSIQELRDDRVRRAALAEAGGRAARALFSAQACADALEAQLSAVGDAAR